MGFFNIFKKKNQEVKEVQQEQQAPTPAKKSFLSSAIDNIFNNKKLDDSSIEELEEVLLQADISFNTCQKILSEISSTKFNKNISQEQIKEHLAQQILKIATQSDKKLDFSSSQSTKTIVFNGVNGSGKTTTIGKIAHNLSQDGKKVLIAACDTFRAGAADQLASWAGRSNCELIRAEKEGQDPASVAFKAIKQAKEGNYDFLLIDTAGRLQNKKNLMQELEKIKNVIKKFDSEAPHENILVIDGTIGQNAKSQTEIFDEIVGISGIIITKLDGSAKGGIAISLIDEFKKPIYAIGMGEKVSDLKEFDPQKYVENLIN